MRITTPGCPPLHAAIAAALFALMTHATAAGQEGDGDRADTRPTITREAVESGLSAEGWELTGDPLPIVEPDRVGTLYLAGRRDQSVVVQLTTFDNSDAAAEMVQAQQQREEVACVRRGRVALVVTAKDPSAARALIEAILPGDYAGPDHRDEQSAPVAAEPPTPRATSVSAKAINAGLTATSWDKESVRGVFSGGQYQLTYSARREGLTAEVQRRRFHTPQEATDFAQEAERHPGAALDRRGRDVLVTTVNGDQEAAAELMVAILAQADDPEGEDLNEDTNAASPSPASPAAEPPPAPTPTLEERASAPTAGWEPWNPTEMFLQVLGGLAGGALGALGGGLTLLLLTEDAYAAITGFGLGFYFGQPAGVTLVGDAFGGDGGYWSSFGANILGLLGGALVVVIVGEAAGSEGGAFFGGLLGFSVMLSSGVLGYHASATPTDEGERAAPWREPQRPPTGAATRAPKLIVPIVSGVF